MHRRTAIAMEENTANSAGPSSSCLMGRRMVVAHPPMPMMMMMMPCSLPLPAPPPPSSSSSSSLPQRETTTPGRDPLAVSVKILFQYLGRVDAATLILAKEVLKDCERKHYANDSKFDTLSDAINERVRNAVGEKHWTRARVIQKQLIINRLRKRAAVTFELKDDDAKKIIIPMGGGCGCGPTTTTTMNKTAAISTMNKTANNNNNKRSLVPMLNANITFPQRSYNMPQVEKRKELRAAYPSSSSARSIAGQSRSHISASLSVSGRNHDGNGNGNGDRDYSSYSYHTNTHAHYHDAYSVLSKTSTLSSLTTSGSGSSNDKTVTTTSTSTGSRTSSSAASTALSTSSSTGTKGSASSTDPSDMARGD